MPDSIRSQRVFHGVPKAPLAIGGAGNGSALRRSDMRSGGMKQRIRASAVAAAIVLVTFGGSTLAAAPEYDWKTVPWGGGGYVDGLVYHPKVKDLLYARTDVGGVYRFDFAARRWIPLLDSLSRADGDMNGILSVALDPNDADKLYLACGLYLGEYAHNAAVLRSGDRGVTWTKTDLPFKLGGNADGRGTGERLQVDPNSGSILFLGSNQDGLWKSSDGARSFAKVSGFPHSGVTLVLFDSNSGTTGAPSQTLYVGSAEPGGLYVSRDGGATFAPLAGAPSQTPQHAVIGPDGYLYVAFAAGDGKSKNALNPSNVATGSVWKMELKTGKWQEITPIRPVPGGGTFGYSGIDVDPAHPGTIVTSTIDRWWPEPDEIFLSRDGGLHWLALTSVSQHDLSHLAWIRREDSGFAAPGKDRMGSWTSDVKINPFNPDEMIYGTGGGLWMSRNLTVAGSGPRVQFDFADDNLEETAIIGLISPPDGATLLAAMGDVGGGSWDDLAKPPGTLDLFSPNASHRSVDVAWLHPAFIARSTDTKPYGHYSEDGGVHWTPFPSAPPYTPQDAKGNWRTIGPLAVSAGGTSIVWSLPREKAYVSFDKGKSWAASEGWPAESDAALVPVADRAVNGVFYVHDRTAGQILISVDAGKSFKPIIKGIPPVAGWQGAQLAAVPGRMRDLWLAAPSGLYHSAEASKPLANVKDVDEAWYVGFGKAAPGKTYPAVYLSGKIKGQTGIWRSDDEGQNWIRINDDVHRFGDGGLLTGDPTEFGTVYVARGAGGVIVGRPAK